jgi:hypothetical protein
MDSSMLSLLVCLIIWVLPLNQNPSKASAFHSVSIGTDNIVNDLH